MTNTLTSSGTKTVKTKASVEEKFALPLLTPKEIETLKRRPAGINPAPMLHYKNLQEFKHLSNNFYLAFAAAEGSFAWYIHRRKKAFQRLAVLHPLLHKRLTQKLQSQDGQPIDEHTWQDLFKAYKLTMRLVDLGDDYVVQDGEVDDWYLCR